jgi:hypothetical protein
MKSTRSALIAATTMSMLAGLDILKDAMPTLYSKSINEPKPRPRLTPEMAREIAEHNAKVEARKAEKRARWVARHTQQIELRTFPNGDGI